MFRMFLMVFFSERYKCGVDNPCGNVNQERGYLSPFTTNSWYLIAKTQRNVFPNASERFCKGKAGTELTVNQ